MHRLAAALFAAFLLAAPVEAKEPTPAPTPSFDWQGVWAVFDDGVDLVNLAVAADGTVATTRRADDEPSEVGRWQATEDALFVRYDSGRGETILRHASGFRHVSRREDRDTGDRTTRIGAAFRITSPTVPFVGAWRVDGNGESAVTLLRSDGTAERVAEPRVTGLWRVVDGRAGIHWQDGAHETFDPSKPGIRRAGPRPVEKRADDE